MPLWYNVHQFDSTYHIYFGSEVKNYVFNDSLFIPLSLFLAVSEDAKFFELLKIEEDSPSWASGRSKTFPVILVPFCVSRGNPESQRGEVLGLRIVEVRSGTWVAPDLLPDSGS